MNILTPLLMTLAIHITWFNSNFPAHVFGVLKNLGFNKRTPKYWSESGYETKFYDDWFTWVNLTLPEVLAELLTCPVCLSWHIGFWVNLIFCLLGGSFHVTIFLFNVATGVILSHLINKGHT